MTLGRQVETHLQVTPISVTEVVLELPMADIAGADEVVLHIRGTHGRQKTVRFSSYDLERMFGENRRNY